jgi:hypothetical protein
MRNDETGLNVTTTPSITTDKDGTMVDVVYQIEESHSGEWIATISVHINPPVDEEFTISELRSFAVDRASAILSRLVSQLELPEK